MQKTKRLLALVLALLLALSLLSGCGQTPNNAPNGGTGENSAADGE